MRKTLVRSNSAQEKAHTGRSASKVNRGGSTEQKFQNVEKRMNVVDDSVDFGDLDGNRRLRGLDGNLRMRTKIERKSSDETHREKTIL